MKIYSWNMEFRNAELDRAFEFIAQSNFDIFCLQEVHKDFLARLKTLPFHIADVIESDLMFRGKRSTISSVILSKHPIIHSEVIPLTHYSSERPWRAHFIEKCMYSLRIWAEGLGNRHMLYADLDVPGHSIVRVFNLHLPLMYSNIRTEEFERAMLQKDSQLPTIICGDFNILEKPHITPLNWFFGGRVSDAFLYTRERTRIEKRFVEYELSNPLRGKTTHPLSRSQIDHILVSHSFTIKNAEVISDRHGSDHHPIFVEVA